VLFGLDDTFLNTLIKLLRRLPIYPMFGRGETRLQPTDVFSIRIRTWSFVLRPQDGT